jgi:hypothetical protein
MHLHESDTRSQGSVSFAEVCKCSEIDAQQVREPDPEKDRKNCARQGGREALLDVGSEKVKSFNGENGKADRDQPVDVRPSPKQKDAMRFASHWPKCGPKIITANAASSSKSTT